MRAGSMLLLVVLMAPLAGARSGAGVLPDDPQVWTKWSLTEDRHTKEEVEAGFTTLTADAHRLPALIVVNNRTTSIFNVTLVLIPRNITLFDYALTETHAGDPPGRYYAHWPEIRPGGGGLVPVHLWIGPSSGPFELGAFVVFQDAEGTHGHSMTRIRGTVAGHEDVQTPALPLAFLAPVVVLAALARRPLKRS